MIGVQRGPKHGPNTTNPGCVTSRLKLCFRFALFRASARAPLAAIGSGTFVSVGLKNVLLALLGYRFLDLPLAALWTDLLCCFDCHTGLVDHATWAGITSNGKWDWFKAHGAHGYIQFFILKQKLHWYSCPPSCKVASRTFCSMYHTGTCDKTDTTPQRCSLLRICPPWCNRSSCCLSKQQLENASQCISMFQFAPQSQCFIFSGVVGVCSTSRWSWLMSIHHFISDLHGTQDFRQLIVRQGGHGTLSGQNLES